MRVQGLAAITVAFMMLALGACSRPGSVFLGKWTNAKNVKDTMEIVENGDQFLIVSGKQKLGAVLKDGGLEILGTLGAMRITHIQASDTLVAPGLFGQVEYSREK